MEKREIKFRCWDGEKMVIPACIEGERGVVFLTARDYEEYRHFDSVILMQFTGLLDKNGKAVYEGDVVKFIVPKDGEIMTEDIEYIEEVQFIDGAFCLDGYVPVSSFADESEVIGNVFENPELLTT